jgi:hypothetical protein
LHEENLPSSAWLEHPLPIRDPPGVQHTAANEFLRR